MRFFWSRNYFFLFLICYFGWKHCAPDLYAQGDAAALTKITNGDFVYPVFSPDGTKLAYSKVIVRKKIESTEVLVYDFVTKKTSIILTNAKAMKYATYSVFVTALKWPAPRKVTVELADGDVDGALLTIDPTNGKLLHEKFLSAGDDIDAPERKALRKKFTSFLAWPESVLDSALDNQPVYLGKQRYLLQKRYFEMDQHVWLVDTAKKMSAVLLALQPNDNRDLLGGFALGDSILFMLSSITRPAIYLSEQEQPPKIIEMKMPEGMPSFETKYKSESRVLFLVKIEKKTDTSESILFSFDGKLKRLIPAIQNLEDVTIAPKGDQMAYTVWEAKQRHIYIKKLP